MQTKRKGPESHENFYKNSKLLLQLIKNCTEKGIDITVGGFQNVSSLYNPYKMYNWKGII